MADIQPTDRDLILKRLTDLELEHKMECRFLFQQGHTVALRKAMLHDAKADAYRDAYRIVREILFSKDEV